MLLTLKTGNYNERFMLFTKEALSPRPFLVSLTLKLFIVLRFYLRISGADDVYIFLHRTVILPSLFGRYIPKTPRSEITRS